MSSVFERKSKFERSTQFLNAFNAAVNYFIFTSKGSF